MGIWTINPRNQDYWCHHALKMSTSYNIQGMDSLKMIIMWVLEKLTVTHLVKELSAFYGTWRFITIFITAHHRSLSSWARWMKSKPPHLISLRSIIILSSSLCLGLLNGLFLSGFPTKILYVFLISLVQVICPPHLILLDLITLIILGEAYMLWSSSTQNTFQPPTISTLLGPNTLLSTLFSNTLNLCSSFSIRDQIPIQNKRKIKHSEQNGSKHFTHLICS